jgi:hypothetical protein
VIQSLEKYKIGFHDSESTEELCTKLADFYAQLTLTKRPILPQDCAAAIVWLAGDQSAKPATNTSSPKFAAKFPPAMKNTSSKSSPMRRQKKWQSP